MEKELNTKQKLLNAFKASEKKTIADVCNRVGITEPTFYFHYNGDLEFRRKVLEIRQAHTNAKFEAKLQAIGV